MMSSNSAMASGYWYRGSKPVTCLALNSVFCNDASSLKMSSISLPALVPRWYDPPEAAAICCSVLSSNFVSTMLPDWSLL